MLITSYYKKDFEPFLGSLPDFYAVAASIKPLSRLTILQTDLKKTLEVLDKFGIYHREKKIKNRFNLYISKDKNLLNQYPKKDPELKNKMLRVEAADFAEDLGYPSCCIKEYISRNMGSTKEYYSNFFSSGKYSFLLNNFLAGGSNYYLSFHKPCSMKCKKSIIYNKKILNSIKKFDNGFYNELLYHLKTEQILILDAQNDINSSWDNRFSIIKNSLGKDSIKISKPNYSRIKFEKKFYDQIKSSEDIKVKDTNNIGFITNDQKKRFFLDKNLISFSLNFF